MQQDPKVEGLTCGIAYKLEQELSFLTPKNSVPHIVCPPSQHYTLLKMARRIHRRYFAIRGLGHSIKSPRLEACWGLGFGVGQQ